MTSIGPRGHPCLSGACGKCLRWREALHLLTEAPLWEPLACGAALRACSHDWRLSLELYQAISTMEKDVEIYSTALSACATAGQLRLLHEPFRELARVAFHGLAQRFRGPKWLPPQRKPSVLLPFQPPKATMEASKARVARLGALGQQGRWRDALALAPLDVYGLAAATGACGARWQQALGLLALPIEANGVVFNSLASVCRRRWPWALEVVAQMRRQLLEANVVSFTSLVHAGAQARRWQRALQALQAMEACDLEPNVVSFGSAMTACSGSVVQGV